jgi:hypothetical protein
MVAESSEAPSLMTPAHDGKSFKVPWQDESVSSINRLPARSAVRPCSKDGREYVLSLDGEWDFEWLTVNIDCAMTGVGGDDAWGARPHAAYLLKGAKTYTLKFTIAEWGVPCRGQIVYN